MITSRLLLAAVVVLTTDPGGCHSDIGDDRPPSVSITEARAKVDDWVRDWSLGPGEVTDCGHNPDVWPGTVCTVQRQGQTLVVGVDRWPNGGPLIIHEDGVGAEDPEAFIARALDLLGPTPRSVDCSGDTSFDPCVARFGRGEPLREVRLVPHGGFVDAQVEAPGSGRTTVVGGGPLLRVALERHQHLDGPNVTVRGTVSDNPVTGTPVSDVCVGTDEFLGAESCAEPDQDGGFAIPMVLSSYPEALRVSASDIAGATTDALVPVSVHERVARLRLLAPRKASTTSSSAVTVAWRVNHPDLVTSVDVQVDGEVAATFDPDGRSTGTVVIDRVWTAPGQHTVALMAVTTDRAGWTMTTPIRLTYTP